MSEIYYSKRTGIDTENLLRKGNGINVNLTPTRDIYLDSFEISNKRYKSKQDANNYVYIHNLTVSFSNTVLNSSKQYNIKIITKKSDIYSRGNEEQLFKELGGIIFIYDFDGRSFNVYYNNNLPSNYNVIYLYENENNIVNIAGSFNIISDVIEQLDAEVM